MILVTATEQNCTSGQLSRATRILEEYVSAGFKPRNSHPQLDEVTGHIVLTFDIWTGLDWETLEIQVSAEGRFRTYSRPEGWTEWSEWRL